ncbi:MAG: alpha/beta hydrolase, partial [Bacteroidota bacterium]|nr:alpha/beta hydrolase [Bacteroidota bacterium]
MRYIKSIGKILLFIILIYFLGPKPAIPKLSGDLPAIPADPVQLEKFIRQKEAQHKIKPDNEARIIWFNDSLKNKTEYSVVYIHGFSASQGEGNPVHINFAKKFGCNLFLSRLAEHGIDTADAMIHLTADELWNSAKEAYM